VRRYVEILPEEGKKDIWRVRVSTVIQRNADLTDPLNPAKAEWRRAGPDPEDAERVVYLIESEFRDFGPSPEFEMR
jgi:hypothetical protein